MNNLDIFIKNNLRKQGKRKTETKKLEIKRLGVDIEFKKLDFFDLEELGDNPPTSFSSEMLEYSINILRLSLISPNLNDENLKKGLQTNNAKETARAIFEDIEIIELAKKIDEFSGQSSFREVLKKK